MHTGWISCVVHAGWLRIASYHGPGLCIACDAVCVPPRHKARNASRKRQLMHVHTSCPPSYADASLHTGQGCLDRLELTDVPSIRSPLSSPQLLGQVQAWPKLPGEVPSDEASCTWSQQFHPAPELEPPATAPSSYPLQVCPQTSVPPLSTKCTMHTRLSARKRHHGWWWNDVRPSVRAHCPLSRVPPERHEEPSGKKNKIK